jgi:glycosyltransferase involved in cell wall biosynthesis
MAGPALRVLFDTSLAENPAGTGTFARGVRAALGRLDGVEIVDASFQSMLGDLDVGRRGMARRLWNATAHFRYYGAGLPAAAARANCDVIFSPSAAGPLRGRTPSVITMHDLTPLRFPETVDPLSGLYLRGMYALQIRRSRMVCTVSQAVRAEILARYRHLKPDHVVVAPDGPNEELLQATPAALEGLQPPFFLMVGTVEPRKNHLTVFTAFARFGHTHPESKATLVVAGPTGWRSGPIVKAVSDFGLTQRLRWAGQVDLGTLRWLYQNARALLFPSLYEGFGIPVLEAMRLGCDVIAAMIPAVQEVAQDAATLIDPLDVSGWSRAIEAAAGASPDRGRLDRARQRAERFTWDACARAVKEALSRAADGSAPLS